jgi:putative SOS response-associated peptidase YedK
MCNLYRMTKPNSEVARWFDAIDQLGEANFGEEVFPGYSGAVVADGALVSMTWGFPLGGKGAKGSRSSPSRSTMRARTSSTAFSGATASRNGAA